jgi:hypothetical protein
MTDFFLIEPDMRPTERDRLALVMASNVYQHARRVLGLRLVSLELFPFAPRDAVEPDGGRDAIFEITTAAPCSGAYSSVPLGPCAISFYVTTILSNGKPLVTETLEVFVRHSEDGQPLEPHPFAAAVFRLRWADGLPEPIRGPQWERPRAGLPSLDVAKAPTREEFDAAPGEAELATFAVGSTVVTLTGGQHENAIVTLARVVAHPPDSRPSHEIELEWLTEPYHADLIEPERGGMPTWWPARPWPTPKSLAPVVVAEGESQGLAVEDATELGPGHEVVGAADAPARASIQGSEES